MCFCGAKGTANISVSQGRTMENAFKIADVYSIDNQ